MTFVTNSTSIPRAKASDEIRTWISPFLKAFNSLLHPKKKEKKREQLKLLWVSKETIHGVLLVNVWFQKYYLRTAWLRPPEYSFAFIIESPKKLSSLHRRRVVSTEDVKTIHFSPSSDFKRPTKYTGFTPVSQICWKKKTWQSKIWLMLKAQTWRESRQLNIPV